MICGKYTHDHKQVNFFARNIAKKLYNTDNYNQLWTNDG